MPRRLPPPLPLALALAVGLFALASALTARPPAAQPTPPAAGTPGTGIKQTQEENHKLYKRFADELLKLAQKWEKSDSTEERERAKSLRTALKIADEKGVESLFRGVLNTVGGLKSGPEFDAILAKDAALTKALQEILETLETEGEADKIAREIKDLKELIKEAARIKREQETLLARTGTPRSDPNKIAKDQADLAKQTKDLATKLDKTDPKDAKDPKDPKGGPPANPNEKDDKSDPKGEGKPGESSAEPKPDTKDPKSDGKDPKDGDPKGGDPKPTGDPKGGMKPDAGESKDSPKEGGEPKPMGGDPKPPMPGDPKGADAKPMPPSDSKAQGEGKGDAKPSPPMGGEAKPMAPGDSPPSDSPPSSGSPKPGSPSPGSPPPPSGPKPPNPNNPNDEAKRNVEEAVPPQNDAEKDLKKNDRPNATKNEDLAIKKLTDAIKELEKRLKQLREKEMLKKLEDLERRVAKMLKMQIEVYEATKGIDTLVKKNSDQKTTADIQKAGVEGEKEGEIALEAEKAARLLEGEGTAVVFAAVLSEARKDMESVQKQLTAANVGPDTQLVEEQIITQLQRMLEALKKAKQDLENPPPPPPPGMPPPPGDQKKNLIQLVEQLKLLKSLQVQVNDRTTAFGKRSPGEQAGDPFLQEQLKQLGDRQKVLQDMLHKIAIQMSQQ